MHAQLAAQLPLSMRAWPCCMLLVPALTVVRVVVVRRAHAAAPPARTPSTLRALRLTHGRTRLRLRNTICFCPRVYKAPLSSMSGSPCVPTRLSCNQLSSPNSTTCHHLLAPQQRLHHTASTHAHCPSIHAEASTAHARHTHVRRLQSTLPSGPCMQPCSHADTFISLLQSHCAPCKRVTPAQAKARLGTSRCAVTQLTPSTCHPLLHKSPAARGARHCPSNPAAAATWVSVGGA